MAEIMRVVVIALLLVVLALNLTVLQINVALNLTVLEPNFYDRLFERQYFYDQLGQWLLSRLGTELPHGSEGLPYFERALAGKWLRQETMLVLNQLFGFLKGEQDELPMLRIYSFREEVMTHINDDWDMHQKEKMLEYWLGPVPQRVRVQDIMSINAIWNLRQAVVVMRWAVWASGLVALIIFGLLLVVTRSWRQSILWLGSGIFAAGILVIGIALLVSWLGETAYLIESWETNMVAQGFNRSSVRILFESFMQSITNQLNSIAFPAALVGFLTVNWVPLEKD